MTLKVVTFMSYFSGFGAEPQQWPTREETWRAFFAVKALKGDQIKKRQSEYPCCDGITRTYSDATKDSVIDWVGATIAKEMEGLGPFLLIPIPSSQSTSPQEVERLSRTFRLATAIAAHLDDSTLVAPSLWWTKPMTPARQGGDREPEKLFPSLACAPIRRIAPGAMVVLVDDVCSTGGHLQAAEARIRASSNANVAYALCAAQTAKHGDEPPAFESASRELPLFQPHLGRTVDVPDYPPEPAELDWYEEYRLLQDPAYPDEPDPREPAEPDYAYAWEGSEPEPSEPDHPYAPEPPEPDYDRDPDY